MYFSFNITDLNQTEKLSIAYWDCLHSQNWFWVKVLLNTVTPVLHSSLDIKTQDKWPYFAFRHLWDYTFLARHYLSIYLSDNFIEDLFCAYIYNRSIMDFNFLLQYSHDRDSKSVIRKSSRVTCLARWHSMLYTGHWVCFQYDFISFRAVARLWFYRRQNFTFLCGSRINIL